MQGDGLYSGAPLAVNQANFWSNSIKNFLQKRNEGGKSKVAGMKECAIIVTEALVTEKKGIRCQSR